MPILDADTSHFWKMLRIVPPSTLSPITCWDISILIDSTLPASFVNMRNLAAAIPITFWIHSRKTAHYNSNPEWKSSQAMCSIHTILFEPRLHYANSIDHSCQMRTAHLAGLCVLEGIMACWHDQIQPKGADWDVIQCGPYPLSWNHWRAQARSARSTWIPRCLAFMTLRLETVTFSKRPTLLCNTRHHRRTVKVPSIDRRVRDLCWIVKDGTAPEPSDMLPIMTPNKLIFKKEEDMIKNTINGELEFHHPRVWW